MAETEQTVPDPPAQEPAGSQSPAPQQIIRQQWIERWLEVISAILLGGGAGATAWSGYQSTRWGGVQSTKYTEAAAKRVESIRAETLAGQNRLYDVALFNQCLNATYRSETMLASAYEQRFRPEFRPAFAAWLPAEP